MSKLLRITTSENDGTFDSDLDSSFELPPNSTVALQSANFTFDTEELILDMVNQHFQQALGNNFQEVEITDRHNFFADNEKVIYNVTNFHNLLLNFEAAINDSIFNFSGGLAEEDEAGYEAKVETNLEQKVVIRLERERMVDWNNSPEANQFVLENLNIVVPNNNSFQKGGAAGQDGFICDRHVWNRGGAFARCRIHNLVVGGGNLEQGFTFGIVSENNLYDFQAGAGITANNFCYAIRVRASGVTMVQSTEDPTDKRLIELPTNATLENISGGTLNDHDSFVIFTENDRFKCKHYTTTHPTGADVVADFSGVLGEDGLDFSIYDPNINYYVALLIEQGDDNSTFVDLVGAINSPFFSRAAQPTQSKLQLTSVLQTHENVMRLANVPNIPPTPSTFQLEFTYNETGTLNSINNTELRDFLGYNTFSINPTPTIPTDTYNFIANNPSSGFLKSQTFVVQLVSLPVESYDSFSGKKENTIYTIVENTALNRTQELSFNSQYPIFIQLKNKNPILLRRLKARIVDHELEKINTHGVSQLTLLFNKE